MDNRVVHDRPNAPASPRGGGYTSGKTNVGDLRLVQIRDLGPRSRILVVAAVVVGLVAFGWLRLGMASRESVDPHSLIVDGDSLSVGVINGVLQLTLTAAASKAPTVVAAVPIDQSEVVVRQAVCPPASHLGQHVVIFGRVAQGISNPVVTISGLGAGTMTGVVDGLFVFVSTDPPDPTASWIVDVANLGAIHGHVGVYGSLQRDTTGTAPCVVNDPTTEILKP